MAGQTPAQRPPSGLGDAGSALWRELTSRYTFDGHELPILAAACHQADMTSALEAVIAESGPVVSGSKGQPRLAPAITEARLGRLALARLLGELAIPAEDAAGTVPMTASARRAQKAAQARWTRVEQRREERDRGKGA